MQPTQKPTKKRTLAEKVIIALVLLAILGKIMGSHSNNGADEQVNSFNGTSDNASNQSTAENFTNIPKYKKIGDQIDIGNFSYVVNSIKFIKTIGGEFTQQTADGVYLVVSVTFRNNDNKEHTLDNSFFKLTDENGAEYESSIDGATALEMEGKETLFLKQCNPNITKKGLIIFEVPEKKVYDLHLSGGFWSGKTAVVKLTTK